MARNPYINYVFYSAGEKRTRAQVASMLLARLIDGPSFSHINTGQEFTPETAKADYRMWADRVIDEVCNLVPELKDCIDTSGQFRGKS